jgi:hypothetical protein
VTTACTCVDQLLAEALRLYAAADKLDRRRDTRDNAETVRRQAAGCGWAAGFLARQQEVAT